VIVEHRWWSIAELQAKNDVVFPENRIALFEQIADDASR